MQLLLRPFHDYSGRFSPLKTAVFCALFIPALWIASRYPNGGLGARPLTEALHQFGDWTIRFIFIALAVTPAAQLLQWNRLLLVRRMIGVAAFAYAAMHLSLYAADEMWNLAKVFSEILLRVYLAIGFVAWLGLAALAATSTDGMIRRLGPRRWQALHRFVYLIAVLAVVHYFLQSKLQEWQPTLMAGFYAWLMGYRILARAARPARRPALWTIALLGIGVGVTTALGEIFYFHIAMNVPAERILPAELWFDANMRPGMAVLLIGIAVAVVASLRALFPARRKPATPRPAI